MLRCSLSTSVMENTFKKNLLNTRSRLIETTQRMTYHFDYQGLQVWGHVAAAATFCLDQRRFKTSAVTVWVLFALCQPLHCFAALQEFAQSTCDRYLLEAFKKHCSKRLSLQNSEVHNEKTRLVFGEKDGTLTSA